MSWLRWSIVRLSLRNHWFSPKPIYLKFMTFKAAPAQVASKYVLGYSSLITVPQTPHIHSTIRDTIQFWQLTVSLNNTPQKSFKIGYLTKRGGKEERHANANIVQLLARISKDMIYRRAKCVVVVTGLLQDINSSLSDPQLTHCTRQATYM